MPRTALLLLAATVLSACGWRPKDAMYLTVSNSSGDTLRNFEVRYPGGVYGIPSLANAESRRKNITVNKGCKVSLRFETREGREVSPPELNFGEKCPPEVILSVDAAMNVSGKALQK